MNHLQPATPLLFRGDAGLPPGILPASPLFQLQLRRGHSFTNSFDHCRLIVKIANDQDRDGDADIAELVEDSTHLQSPHNPFVSMSSDLATAKRYAELGCSSSVRPYITLVVPRDTSRVIDFRSRLSTTATALANREIGIIGMIEPDEVMLRVYLDDLGKITESQMMQSAFQPAGIAPPTWSIPDQHLTELFSQEYCCPRCGTPLPYYFRRFLGSDSKVISVLDVSGYRKPFFRPAPADSYLAGFLSGRPSALDLMIESGILCCCRHCDAYLSGPPSHRANLVTIAIERGRSQPTLVLTNHHRVPLTCALVGIHIESGGENQNLVAKFLFGPGANRVDTSWPRIEHMLKGFDFSEDSIRAMLSHMLQQDPMVAPSDSRELPLQISTEAREYSIRGVSLVRVNFESGDVWSPPSAFDLDWDGFLDAWR
jgi:hypothetical protein